MRVQLATYSQKICECTQILCVDDDPFNLRAITGILTKMKFRCDTANHGQKAIDLVKERVNENLCCPVFTLIFMDLDMPLKNGFEASIEITQFLAQKKLKRSVICAHSAFLDRDAENKAKKAGMNIFLPKPYKNKLLDDILIKNFPLFKMKKPEINNNSSVDIENLQKP
jgi:CheY-like chemotaxis protein